MDPICRIESWFARNGLPQFVDDYNSSEHNWTRASPVLLMVIYLFTRFAILSMFGWGMRQTMRRAGDLYTVATKALPLLLIVMIALFINTEVGQVAGSLDDPVLWASSGLILVFGVLVSFENTHAQISTLEQETADARS